MQSETGYFLNSILNRVVAKEAPPTPGCEVSPAAQPFVKHDACQAFLNFDWTILTPPIAQPPEAGGPY